ncbi:trypsin alpha-3-like [Bradysia coprophila]|uniref:trypsin alpha-3-like n=1 Tax=Bradysia coprophila TaxID=38358 RepID=UPI00187DC98E|nr:trypsin alpha-3-like [Bradysia coprophila]
MKLLEVVYIFALAACFAGNCACISSGTSVTNPNAYPFQAAVLCPVTMCSGAVVSSKSVVTTATCVNMLSPEDVELYVGSNMYYSGGFTHSVAVIATHPNFNPTTYHNNIAVLTSATQFENVVVPISLATTPPFTGTTLFATAFGAVDPDLTLPDTLQRAGLVAFGFANCQTLKSNRLTTSMFCAGDLSGHKDLCSGDEGAPLVYQNKLYGIYSWGCSCGLAATSSPVFNLISYFGTWIQSAIATNE